MPPITFNASPIFGPATYAWPSAGEPATQINTYPGVNGMEKLHHGNRGMTTKIKGELEAADFPSLGISVLNLLELVANGTVGTFTDSYGMTWPGVWVSGFEQVGPPTYTPGIGVSVSYTATLNHLVTP